MPSPLKAAARVASLLCSLSFALPTAGLLLAPASVIAQETEPITLTISESFLSRTYSGAKAVLDPATDLSISPGTSEGYTFKITYAGKTAAPQNAGTYAVKVVATTKTGPVRTATTTGSLVIAKAPLQVSGGEQARLFGSSTPALVPVYSGFVNDETFAVLDRRPAATTSAKSTSPAGNYAVTIVGGSDNNYEILGREPGVLTIVPAFPGTYESLVYDFSAPNLPVGKLTLTLPARGTKFTGRLDLAREGAALSLSGDLSPDETFAGAIGTASRRAASGDTFRVSLSVGADGLLAELFVRENGSSDEMPVFFLSAPTIVSPFSSASPFAPAGAYTFALLTPSPADPVAVTPAGLGHATATLSANGTLKLAGKFADGSTLTASTLPDSTLRHRLFLRPYGSRKNSYASGELVLEQHTDPERSTRVLVPITSARVLYWAKAAKPSGTPDSLFPDGFEPIENVIVLDPWLSPVKAKAATSRAPAVDAITLAQRLGLASDEESPGFALIDHGIEDLGASIDELPFSLEFTSANQAKPVLLDPPANPRAWKLTSLNTANGRFTGTFKLTDPVEGTNRSQSRTITFQGILRQPPAPGDTTVGAGYFILKPLPGALDPAIRSVDIRFLNED